MHNDFAWLSFLGGAIDESVDRLAADGSQTAFISSFQPARDLLRRPPFREAVAKKVRKARSPSITASAQCVQFCTVFTLDWAYQSSVTVEVRFIYFFRVVGVT
jgi:hypothetical protein